MFFGGAVGHKVFEFRANAIGAFLLGDGAPPIGIGFEWGLDFCVQGGEGALVDDGEAGPWSESDRSL